MRQGSCSDSSPRVRLTCLLQRWREALDPKIKRGPWAEHEDDKLTALFRTHGRKWNDIAGELDGRPPVQVRSPSPHPSEPA